MEFIISQNNFWTPFRNTELLRILDEYLLNLALFEIQSS